MVGVPCSADCRYWPGEMNPLEGEKAAFVKNENDI